MKKVYEKPMAEKIEFDYRNQVVASGECKVEFTNESTNTCNKYDSYPTYKI